MSAGTVYLLHFDREYQPGCRHYLGWTRDLDRRISEHVKGHGAIVTRRAFRQRIGFTVVRLWPDAPLSFEWALKHGGPSLWKLCPVCGDGSDDGHGGVSP